MRRLGMKNKHRKSEAASDSEPEENVDARAASNDDETQAGKNNSPQKSATKRRSARGASVPKPAANDDLDSGNDDSAPVEPKERENGEKKPSPNKRRKKEDQRASTSARDVKSEDAGSEYEVERLINIRTIKGRRQFLVRWVGYGENDDTWENEKDLNCPQLIEDFLAEEKEKEKEIKSSKPPKTDKSKKSSRSSAKKQTQETKETDDEDSEEEKGGISKEFEVERVIEVRFKKNGTKEFLIRWKGFSAADDTWEPERNLNCPELIAKFMEKLEKAKISEMRELRTNRVHTKRYTLSTHDRGRRLSKRNRDKQRTTYHECDE